MPVDLDILADATRRTILALLHTEGELCVCELEAALGLIQPVVSRQLGVLRDAGWVEAEREGRRMFYRLAAVPEWAQLIIRAYAEGGVPAATLRRTRTNLGKFAGRPVRSLQAAS